MTRPDPDQALHEAQRRFLAALDRRLPSEHLPLEAALGRVTAETVTSPEDSPPYPRAIVEGYLVPAEATQGASEEAPGEARIIGRVAPGDAHCPSPAPGEAVEVVTGSLVPDGPYAIVRQWEAQREGERIRFTRPFPPGFFIEARGADIQRGHPLIPAGTRLTPRELGLAASVGLTHLRVSQRPRITVFAIGGEVIPHSQPPQPGQIRDCNSVMLAAALRQAGAEPRIMGILPDDLATVVDRCRRALEHADGLVLAGGTAACGRDFVSELFRELGELVVDGVPMRSGRPLIMGQAEGRPLIGVAGHPPEALRGLHLFGLPAVAHLQGEHLDPPTNLTIPWGAA